MAARQGLALTKSRRRDERAIDFGRYWLTDRSGGWVAFGDSGADLDDIEKYLTR